MTRRLGLYIVAIILCVMVAFVLWRVFTEPGRSQAKANEARAGQVVADAGLSTAITAGKASEKAAEARTSSEALTGANRDEILSTPGSGASVGLVADSGLRALCLRQAYARDPRCHALRPAHP